MQSGSQRCPSAASFAVLLVLLTVLLTGCLGLLPKRGPAPVQVGAVRGLVLYENKEPIEGAEVKVLELDLTVQTDAQGAFLFEELPKGTYTLQVSKPRHIVYTESIQFDDDELLVEVLLPPEGSMLINGSFNVDREPRVNPEGFGDEYIYAWKPFSPSVWVGADTEHVKVVERTDTDAGVALRLLGHETGYVGVRSLHMPVEPGVSYTLTAKSYIEALAEPSRLQIWVEWWPAGITSESTGSRIGTQPRVTGSVLHEWKDMTLTVTAPDNAATATILIIIHQFANLDRLPAEAYLTDLRFGRAE